MTMLELFTQQPILFTFTGLLIGLLVGSFLNVVIYRLPVMMEREWTDQCTEYLEVSHSKTKPHSDLTQFNLSKPDSHCPKCKHKITAIENIPVLSYLVLGGKCSQCKVTISLRYPIIELCTGLLSALITHTYGFTWLCLALLILTWCLITLTMIDIDHQLLPDDITLPLLWLGLVVNTFSLLTPLVDAVWGAILGYLILWSIFWLFKLITGKDGLGYGDFKLLAVLGAWLGWQALPVIILLSSMVGAVIGIGLIVFKGKGRETPIPFGPYLAGAGFITLVWGQNLVSYYNQGLL